MRTLLLLLLPISLFAQNPQLENAIRAYNVLQAYSEPLNFSKLTAEQTTRLQNDLKNGIALTDELARTQTGETAALARYFRAGFRLDEARLLLAQSRPADAMAALETIRPDVESFGEAFFPRTYTLDGKTYTITWASYAPQRAEFYRLSAEAYLARPDYARALEEADRALRHPFARPRTRTAVTSALVEAKTGLQQLDSVRLDYALEGLRSFDRLSPAEQAEFNNEKRNYLRTMYQVIDEAIRAQHQPYPHPGQYYGDAAVVLAEFESTRDEAIAAYTEALRREYGHLGFAEGAYNFAARHYRTKWAGQQHGRDSLLRVLGVAAINHQRRLLRVDDCAAMRRLADRYEKFYESEVSVRLRSEADACQRAADKIKYGREREAHFYVGGYLFPFLAFRNEYRDYGLAVNFGGRRMLVELSYQWINNNRERYTDLLFQGVRTRSIDTRYWSGYYAHLALKFPDAKRGKRYSKPYLGPLVSYNQRNFAPVQARVAGIDGIEQTAEFRPTLRQYALLANFGILKLRGVAFDVFWSFGLSYNEFNGGNDQYWNSDRFTIDDALLEKRNENFINLIGRIGMTIGVGK